MNTQDINLGDISLSINKEIPTITESAATESAATDTIFQTENSNTIDYVLNNESNNYKKEPWCRLDKTTKILKLNTYVNDIVKQKYKLSLHETETLTSYLVGCLDKEKLHRVKEVDYKKELGTITHIPSLHFEKTKRKFTLKRCDKRINTLKSLSKPKRAKKPKKKGENVK